MQLHRWALITFPAFGHICGSFIGIIPGISVGLTSLQLQESFHLSFYMQKRFKEEGHKRRWLGHRVRTWKE